MAAQEALEQLRELHQEVDTAAAEVHAQLSLACGLGCTECCRDDITVFAIEAERIREEAAGVLDKEPHAPGACAFLGGTGECRIYAQRPYVCRTQGLPLRWFDDEGGDVAREYRDICPLNEPTVALLELTPEQCWELGPYEGRLATLQLVSSGGLERVELRGLFSEPE